ncbi:MAG TPA: hypothetical protein VGK00_06700 [Anaerolineales bacterium]|jgi:uncharacterized repeat protein (TIGR01451 family)
MKRSTKVLFNLIDLIVIFVMTFGSPMSALAKVWTEPLDAAPGSVVTIKGDNSDGATYLPNETVQVDVTGPNGGYTLQCTATVASDGSWNCPVTLSSDPALAVGAYTFTALGLASGMTENGTFTDSVGSYNLKWYAADPAVNRAPYLPTYTKVKPPQTCPTGRASDPMKDAVAYGPTFAPNNLDAVTSLMPKNLALGQIVPFEIEIAVSGSTAPENGTIKFIGDWLAKTTSGGDFGFDPTYGVICAFVDYGDVGTVDPLGNAKVDSFSFTRLDQGSNNDRTRGTIQVSGLESGDNIIVEVWVVLKSSIDKSVTGNVQTSLESAQTCTNVACSTGDAIKTGQQTVPLLQVGDFFTAQADLSVTKSDSPDPVVQGQPLSYSLVVTNHSIDTVANGVVVTDTLDANTTFVSGTWTGGTCTAAAGVVTCNVGALTPLQSVTITVNTTVSATAPTGNTTGDQPIGGTCTVGTGFDLCNTVSVTEITSDPDATNNTDSEPTNVLPAFVPAPALSLLKQIGTSLTGPWSSSITVAGGTNVYYQFTITNTGNVALDPISVSDATLSGEESCTWSPTASLSVGGSATCVIGPLTAASLAGTYPNTATASGGYGGTTYNSNKSSAEYIVSPVPALTLTKTDDLNPLKYDHVGQIVTYTLTATNTGNITLHNVTVSDVPALADFACKIGTTVVTIPVASLAPGASIICTGTHTITQGDLDTGSFLDTGKASSNEASAPDAPDTVYAEQKPAINVAKASTTTLVDHAGQVVPYTFTVTNIGNVTLTGVTVVDPKCDAAPAYQSGDTNTDSKLQLTEIWTYTCSHTVTQAELDAATGPNPQLHNLVTADSNESLPDTDTKDIPITYDPEFTLSKTGTLDMTVVAPSDRAEVGDIINYTLTLTNIGNITLTGVTIVDAKLGTLSCNPTQPASLIPGASLVCTGSYTLTQADLNAGTVHNVATGDSNETPPTDTPEDVPVPISPKLIVIKHVITNDGGDKIAANFTMNVSGVHPTSTSFAGSETGTEVILSPGAYSVGETELWGYTATKSADCTGTVAYGDVKTCTITNDDQPGTIIIKKISKPVNTGSFAFTATGTGYNGFSLTGGSQNSQTLNAGTYAVHEDTQLGWILTGIGGSTDPNTPYACTVTGSGGSSGLGDLNTQTATINLKNGDTVTCVFENTGQGVTRTQGFWATHPQLAQIAWFGGTAFGHEFPGVASVIGDRLICGTDIDGLDDLMGGFWSDVSKKSTGAKRISLDQARMQLLQQLLAAELNASAFGSVPAGGTGMFATWESALCGTYTTAIKKALQQAASFNTAGDSATFTPGTSADSKYARSIADLKFWDQFPPKEVTNLINPIIRQLRK